MTPVTEGRTMTDPYSDDRQSENPFAYYEEDASLPVRDYDAEPPSKAEPRTPFSMTLLRLRTFQLTTQSYRLLVLQDRCELMLKKRPTGVVVLRNDAPDCVRIKGRKITLIESGRKFRFTHESEPFGDLLRARLAFWSQTERDLDPLAACHAVGEILTTEFFRWAFRYLLNMIVIFIFAFAMFGSASYVDKNEGNVVFVILLSYLLFYIAIDVLLHRNRKLMFSRKIFFLPLFPGIVITLSFLATHGFIAAILGSIPALWIFFMIFAFCGTLRQLKTDNADLFL